MLSFTFVNVIHYGLFMKKNTLTLLSMTFSLALLAGCGTTDGPDKLFSHHSQTQDSARTNSPSSAMENPDFWQSNPQAVWQKLQQTPLDKLMSAQNTQNTTEVGWVKLAIISKRYSINT